MSKSTSLLFYVLLCFVIIATHLLLNPRWQNSRTEATIGWDVAGYYLYLPAAFIYKDLKQVSFRDSLREKYHFTPNDIQGYIHQPSGHYVMKYPMGQALTFSPFFGIAHLYASQSSTYPADGYSRPYQLSLSLGALLFAMIGLWLMRWILLQYFTDGTTALALASIVLGTNYLNYTAIDGAMTHNTLLTWYALLLVLTILWHRKPQQLLAMGIGLTIGIMALTRPTEVLAAVIPVLWGAQARSIDGLKSHFLQLWKHKSHLAMAAVCAILVGSLQLIYWKYVTGEWIVYSYEDQGFSWLRPHIWDGLLSWKSGWLTYSPLMVLSLVGLIYLRRLARPIWLVVTVFTVLFIYVAFAWDIWWYGGSLGQRTMVQTYAVLVLPIAALWQAQQQWSRFARLFLYAFVAVATYVSLWFTIQAHNGGMLHVGQMTKQYYLATVGRWSTPPEHLKLLDTRYVYNGPRNDVQILLQDTTSLLSVDGDNQYSDALYVPLSHQPTWLRLSADMTIQQKEWNFWTMTQLQLHWMSGEDIIKTDMIRVQRHLNDGQTKRLHLDSKPQGRAVDGVRVQLWNAGGNKGCQASNITVEIYEEG